ncbi:hypothetical protein [Streptomyces sp. NPDC003032]
MADHTPLPGPEARLLVLMLTLRTARTGTGNLVGQDITALELIEKLTGCGWLSFPGTAEDLLASRPEKTTPISVPSLAPHEDRRGPFTFGKKTRPKVSGWAQKVISDKKLRTPQSQGHRRHPTARPDAGHPHRRLRTAGPRRAGHRSGPARLLVRH